MQQPSTNHYSMYLYIYTYFQAAKYPYLIFKIPIKTLSNLDVVFPCSHSFIFFGSPFSRHTRWHVMGWLLVGWKPLTPSRQQFIGVETLLVNCRRCAGGSLPSGYVKIAIENGHRNSGFSHKKLWFSLVFCMFTRVYLVPLQHCGPEENPMESVPWREIMVGYSRKIQDANIPGLVN